MPLWGNILLYLLGLAAGAWANKVFDVQLRRPGIRQSIGLVIFMLLLYAVVTVTGTPFVDLVLPLVWVGTGVLAGAGSRAIGRVSSN